MVKEHFSLKEGQEEDKILKRQEEEVEVQEVWKICLVHPLMLHSIPLSDVDLVEVVEEMEEILQKKMTQLMIVSLQVSQLNKKLKIKKLPIKIIIQLIIIIINLLKIQDPFR